jgi:plastocyanin
MEETPNTQEETNISETESSSVSENQNGFNPLLIGGGLVLLIIVGVVGIMLASNKTASTPENMKTTTPTAQPGTAMTQETASGSASEGTVKTFTVAAENFSFTLPEIKVKMGDTVKITLENKEGMHDWVIDESNTVTKPEGEQTKKDEAKGEALEVVYEDSDFYTFGAQITLENLETKDRKYYMTKQGGLPPVLTPGRYSAYTEASSKGFPQEAKYQIVDIVSRRDAARAEKNWTNADALREELDVLGLGVEDTVNGPKVYRKQKQ